MDTYQDLARKVVVITGAAQGIGLATVKRFVREGAWVVMVDRDDVQLTSSYGEVYALLPRTPASAGIRGGHKMIGEKNRVGMFVADVTSVVDRMNLFDYVDESFGSVDVLINNAGITRDKSFLKMTQEDFDAVIDVNLRSTWALSQLAAEQMKKNENGGVILSASSVVARMGNFGQTNYIASKTGIEGFTKAASVDLARYNIRVNAVAPGFIDTAMTKAMPPEKLEEQIKKIPLGRAGTPDDIANMYAFLASNEAAYITGGVFAVNGGLYMN